MRALFTVISLLLVLLSCNNPVGSIEGTVTDIDGNVYKTIKIGKQWWMAENLRVEHYYDGTQIQQVTGNYAWSTLETPRYCYYNNTTNADSIKRYGAIYNWHAVETGKLAPTGWHVPTEEDWIELEEYLVLNGYNYDGTTDTIGYNKIAKALAAKIDWCPDTTSGAIGNDLTKNNSSGFSALPGGFRRHNGEFVGVGYYGHWWSATEYNESLSYCCGLNYNFWLFGRYYDFTTYGYSVRCVKD